MGNFNSYNLAWGSAHTNTRGTQLLNVMDAAECYSRRAGADRRCRRCGYVQETLPHVLNYCLTSHAEAYQLRHNALLARLERATRVSPGDDLRVNRRVPGLDSALRPDLVVTRGDHVTLVNVTVSFW